MTTTTQYRSNTTVALPHPLKQQVKQLAQQQQRSLSNTLCVLITEGLKTQGLTTEIFNH